MRRAILWLSLRSALARSAPGLVLTFLALAPVLATMVLVAMVLPAMVLPALLEAQVIEEEELEETELETAPSLEGPQDDSDLRILFGAAEETFFNSEDPQAALTSIARVLDAVEGRRRAGELSPEARDVLLRSLAYRSELLFEVGEKDEAEAALGRILELDPEAELDAGAVSGDLIKKFERIRKDRIGSLRITADPFDLELRIDGRKIVLARPPPVDVAGEREAGPGEAGPPGETPNVADEVAAPETTVTLLAGIRLIEATRPGYAPLAQEIEIKAGKEKPHEVVLERTNAVIRLHTRPNDAEVAIDGVPYGKTVGAAGSEFLSSSFAGSYRREDFSAEFLIPDVEAGLRRLEVQKPGYRSYRAELRIDELRDYEMPPIVLEKERGTLVLRDLPSDAELRINGAMLRPDSRSVSSARLTLEPGEHHVQVTKSRTRMFSTRLRLADRQTIEVNVRLRPGLAFLGVLGAKSDDLAQALRLGLGDSDRWSLLDRSREARETLPKAGLTLAAMRQAAAGNPEAVDWPRVQTAVDARAPGLIYVAAVVADDLLVSEADVWVWSAAPGPSRPHRLRLDLGRQADIERLKSYFHQSVALRRPWLGALVITSEAAPHPIIAHLTPGGPLERTGARPGDQIVALSQVPVFSSADVDERLLAAETGETLDLGLKTPNGTESVKVTLGASPRVYSQPIPDLPDPVAFTELLIRSEEARPEQAWILRLNQALILLRARDYEGAVRMLRALKAPAPANGVGQATVDYWLGLALSNAGPTYRDAAVEAFRRAAETPGARLEHHDGPLIAPRAQARLRMLGEGP